MDLRYSVIKGRINLQIAERGKTGCGKGEAAA